MIKFRWEKEFKETPIGKIPKDWNVRPLGKIVTFQRGYDLPSRKMEDGPFPVVRSTGIAGYHREFKAKGPGITLGRSGSIGKPLYIEEDYWPHNTTLFSKEFHNAYPKFVYYMLYVLSDYFQEFNAGSAVPTLNRNHIHPLPVAVPPDVKEQQRIATVLSWFDDLIENKRRQNEILEKVAMAIFKSWFIEFEPFQDEEFVYSEELDMEIPKGWEVKPIGEIINFRYGKGLPERKRKLGPYPVVGSSGIVGYHDEYLTNGPTLVIGRKGNAGSIQLIIEPNYPIDTVFFSDENTPVELVFYLYHYLRVHSLQSVADSDTAVPGLSINLLNLFEVVLPPKPILERFHSLVEPIFRKILINEKEVLYLKKTRNLLLPQLIFGRLRIEVV